MRKNIIDSCIMLLIICVAWAIGAGLYYAECPMYATIPIVGVATTLMVLAAVCEGIFKKD